MHLTRASLRAELMANAVNSRCATVCIYFSFYVLVSSRSNIVAVLMTLFINTTAVSLCLRTYNRCPAVFAVKF